MRRKIQGMKVVAAVTFSRTFPSRKQRNDGAAFISWLLVAKHDALHPSQMNGWRRPGFELFLIIAVFKYYYAVDNIAKTVEIYLLSFELSAFNFYTMLGFRQMSNHYDDGFRMLPRHVKHRLSAYKLVKSKISIFNAYDEEPKLVAYHLMHLCSGCLHHLQLAPMNETQSLMKDTTDMQQVWC